MALAGRGFNNDGRFVFPPKTHTHRARTQPSPNKAPLGRTNKSTRTTQRVMFGSLLRGFSEPLFVPIASSICVRAREAVSLRDSPRLRGHTSVHKNGAHRNGDAQCNVWRWKIDAALLHIANDAPHAPPLMLVVGGKKCVLCENC